MDFKYIDLVATYEEVFCVSEKERVTSYWGDLAQHILKDDVDIDAAREIRDKALDLLGMTKEKFESHNEFDSRSNIKKCLQEKIKGKELLYEKFDLITLFDRPVLFTNERLRKTYIPEGFYKYDIRHDDDCAGDMVELKDSVLVNHWGTVISKEPFEPIEYEDGIRTTAMGLFIDDSDYGYTGETMTLSEYSENYEQLKEQDFSDGMSDMSM